MWITQEPKKVALWNKRHFEEKNGECAACLKYPVLLFVEKKYIKCNIWRVAVRPSYIQDARFLKIKLISTVGQVLYLRRQTIEHLNPKIMYISQETNRLLRCLWFMYHSRLNIMSADRVNHGWKSNRRDDGINFDDGGIWYLLSIVTDCHENTQICQNW